MTILRTVTAGGVALCPRPGYGRSSSGTRSARPCHQRSHSVRPCSQGCSCTARGSTARDGTTAGGSAVALAVKHTALHGPVSRHCTHPGAMTIHWMPCQSGALSSFGAHLSTERRCCCAAGTWDSSRPRCWHVRISLPGALPHPQCCRDSTRGPPRERHISGEHASMQGFHAAVSDGLVTTRPRSHLLLARLSRSSSKLPRTRRPWATWSLRACISPWLSASDLRFWLLAGVRMQQPSTQRCIDPCI